MKNSYLPITLGKKIASTALFLLCLTISAQAVGPATLCTGDVVIIGVSSDSDDEFTWVPLVDLSAGEVLYFSNAGYDGGWMTHTSHWVIKYETPAGGITAGTRMTWSVDAAAGYGSLSDAEYTLITSTTNFGSFSGSSSNYLTTSGDQVVVFQSTDTENSSFTNTDLTVLFAVTTHATVWSTTGGSTNNSTDLYPGLTDGVNCVAVGNSSTVNDEVDNSRYTGATVSGDKATILAAVAGNGNWTPTNSSVADGWTQGGVASDFTVTATPTCTDPGSTWDGTDATTSSTDVCVSAGNTATGADVECNDLEVESGNTLTISHVVTVNGDITNDGTITIEDGGYLYQNVSTDANSSSGTYNVQQTSPSYADDQRYSFWSSPVSGEQLQDVFSSSNTSDFYFYNNWPWTAVSASSTMASGFGYTATSDVNGSGAVTRTFSSGTIHNGDITIAGLGTDLSDWILIGNPYPSVLDLEELETDNSHLSNSFWFWNQLSGGSVDSLQDYAQYVKGTGGTAATSGGSVPNQYADKCQGFMIQFSSAANITFNNSQRSASASIGFFKNNQHTDRELIWLGLVNNDAPYSNQILVGFVPGATDAYEEERDGIKLKGSSVLSFYSMADGMELGIQGLAKLIEDQPKTIPLGLDVDRAGTYTIRIDSLANIPGDYQIELLDYLGEHVVDLRQNDHQFTVTSSGSHQERFALRVTKMSSGTPTGVDPVQASESELRVIQANRQLNVSISGSSAQLQGVALYDVQGREVYRNERVGSNRVDVSLQSVRSGIYFLRTTTTQNETFTTQIFITN